MPFDIEKLDGVIIDVAGFGKANFSGGQSADANIRVQNISSSGANAPKVPGEIHVVSGHDYVAPYMMSGGRWVKPSFGAITFSNIIDTTTGLPRVFYIHGFTENGLFISRFEKDYGTANLDGGATGGYRNLGYVVTADGFGPGGIAFPTTAQPLVFDPDYTQYEFPPVCFAEGTRIETVSGPVAVEKLKEGDLVVTASGAHRSIKWIGQMDARPANSSRPHEFNPICIQPHAFGQNLPAREIRLSPGHGVFVDGVLVPAGYLVNGATIYQDDVRHVRYFHVELASHDVLIAEGLPCESYLDDGNRRSFRNSGEFVELYGRLDPKGWENACAPVVADGPQLTEIQSRLHAEAEKLGWIKTEESGLHFTADGAKIAPLKVVGNRYWFALPAAKTLVLRSNAGVLAHIMPGMNDERRLGVAVAEMRLNGIAIDLDDPGFGAGFYPVERHEGYAWRWTDGTGNLTLASAEPVVAEVALAMIAPSWCRAAPELRVVA